MMEVLHALAQMHRCSEHGLSDSVLPDSSLSCIPCNIKEMGWIEYTSGTFDFLKPEESPHMSKNDSQDMDKTFLSYSARPWLQVECLPLTGHKLVSNNLGEPAN